MQSEQRHAGDIEMQFRPSPRLSELMLNNAI